MKDYEETLERAATAAASGDNFEAVRLYERAGRVAYNNKLVVDGVVLESKIAAASKARDAGQPTMTELIPAPPPPVPRTPGSDLEYAFVPEHPGSVGPWSLEREGFVVADMRAPAAELAALETQLRRVANVVLGAPPIHPPKGFDVHPRASLGHVESEKERKAHLAQHMPLAAEFSVTFPSYFRRLAPGKPDSKATSKLYRKEEVTCGLHFSVNVLPMHGIQLEDREGIFIPEPRKDGEIGGQPVYGDILIVARPGATFWVPVTTRRVLAYLILEYQRVTAMAEAGAASSRKTQEDILRPEAMAKRRAEEAEARAKGGAGAEQNAHKLEVMNRRYEEDARKALAAGARDANAREQVKRCRDAEALLASNDSTVLDAPACAVIPPHGGPGSWRLVPRGTAGCTPIVAENPKVWNPTLPRSSLQILHVDSISDSTKELRADIGLREDPGDCVAVTNVIRALDWKALASLLER
jgi:hypothetical protein